MLFFGVRFPRAATSQSARHYIGLDNWYVSQALINIHAKARKGETTVEQGITELIAYMAWRSGEKVMQAYNHFYQATGHAAVQKDIFSLLRNKGKQQKLPGAMGQSEEQAALPMSEVKQPASQMNDQHDAVQTSATVYAFLIGTGGYRDDLIELLTSE